MRRVIAVVETDPLGPLCPYSIAHDHPIISSISLAVQNGPLGFTNAIAVFPTPSGSGARDSVVVKALCYKPEGRGFDTR
jgi:hypothetical protein